MKKRLIGGLLVLSMTLGGTFAYINMNEANVKGATLENTVQNGEVNNSEKAIKNVIEAPKRENHGINSKKISNMNLNSVDSKNNESNKNALNKISSDESKKDLSSSESSDKNQPSSKEKDAKNINLNLSEKDKEALKEYAIKYEDKNAFVDLGANIDGWKEIGKDRYYQVTLYSKSVQGGDLTGIVDRILINRKGDVLKSETGYPLSSIEGIITKLTLSNEERVEIENIAKHYEVSLNNDDIEVKFEGTKEMNGKEYYKSNLYLKSMEKEGIFEPLLKLYINKDGDVVRNLES